MRLGFAKLGKSLKKVGAGFSKFAKVASVAATAVSAAMLLMIKQTANFGDNLDKTSQKTGVLVEDLQRLRLAARIGGASSADMDKGIRFLSRSISEAADGMVEYQDAFESMGVSFVTNNGGLRDTKEVMLDIADFFSTVQDGAAKTTDAMAVFGRAGTNLIPMLNEGAAGIKEIGERLLSFTTDEQADEAAVFNDELEFMRSNIAALSRDALQPVLPLMTEWFQTINDGLPIMQKWIQDNVDLAGWLIKIKDIIKDVDFKELFDVSLDNVRAAVGEILTVIKAAADFIMWAKNVDPLGVKAFSAFLGSGSVKLDAISASINAAPDPATPEELRIKLEVDQGRVMGISSNAPRGIEFTAELGLITP
jgi:hypothetical protein